MLTLEVAIEKLIAVAKTTTYGNVIKSDEAIDALGLNPYCVNEGRASSEEKVDISSLTEEIRTLLMEI